MTSIEDISIVERSGGSRASGESKKYLSPTFFTKFSDSG